MKKKMICALMLLMVALMTLNVSWARLDDGYGAANKSVFESGGSQSSGSQSVKAQRKSLLDQILDQGNGLNGRDDGNFGGNIANYIKNDVVPVVGVIGNLVFAAVTVILGAKYIWSGADGKSTVKETLPTFIAAVIFFYAAESLVNVFFGATGGLNTSSYNSLANQIIGTINNVVRYAAFGGILVIGLKYMFESADGKAKIKERLVPMVLGIVLVFSATTFVNFIITIGRSTLN